MATGLSLDHLHLWCTRIVPRPGTVESLRSARAEGVMHVNPIVLLFSPAGLTAEGSGRRLKSSRSLDRVWIAYLTLDCALADFFFGQRQDIEGTNANLCDNACFLLQEASSWQQTTRLAPSEAVLLHQFSHPRSLLNPTTTSRLIINRPRSESSFNSSRCVLVRLLSPSPP